MKKYLILSASYWSWHNAAAWAIKNSLEKKWEKVEILDMTDLLKKWWDNSKKFYSLSEKIPFIWDATFTLLDQQFTNEILDIIFKSIYQNKFNQFLEECNPDYIICTFPNWPIFLNNYYKTHKKIAKIWVIITDAIEIWMPWHYSSDLIDYFFMIDENTKQIFKKKFKHRRNNLFVSFFPIEEKYFINKKSIQNKHIAILLTWLKAEFTAKLLNKLKEEEFYEKITIIKWRNEKLFDKIKNKVRNSKFEYIEFLDIKTELKNIDIFITKPGWALMCECIAQDVPLIAPSFIPGQEEWNIKLLEKENLWIYEDSAEKVVFFLKFLNWDKFLPNFHRIKNKDSVEFIIKKITSN